MGQHKRRKADQTRPHDEASGACCYLCLLFIQVGTAVPKKIGLFYEHECELFVSIDAMFFFSLQGQCAKAIDCKLRERTDGKND